MSEPAERQQHSQGDGQPVLTDWREAFGNRAFIGFAMAMFASYALSFQVSGFAALNPKSAL